MQFDAPITRLAERNTYRQSLDRVPAGPPQLLQLRRRHRSRPARPARQLDHESDQLRAAAAGRDRGRPAGHAQCVHRSGVAADCHDSRHRRPRRRAGPHRPAQRPEQLHEHLDQLRSAAAAASTSTSARCSSTARGCGSIQARSARTTANTIPGCGAMRRVLPATAPCRTVKARWKTLDKASRPAPAAVPVAARRPDPRERPSPSSAAGTLRADGTAHQRNAAGGT